VSPRTNSIRIGWWLLGDDAVSAAFQPPKPPAVTVRVDPKSVREVGGRTFHVPRNESLFTIASERLPDRRRLPVAGTEAAAVGDCFSLNRPAPFCLRRSIKAPSRQARGAVHAVHANIVTTCPSAGTSSATI
jgi:hypothetical protein